MTDAEQTNVVQMPRKTRDSAQGQTSSYVRIDEKNLERVKLFAQLVAQGENGTDAVLKAGLADSRKAASIKATRLLRTPAVQKILDAQLSDTPAALEQASVDKTWIVERLRVEAVNGPVPSARVRALELLGRIAGIYAPEEQRVEHVGSFFADIDDASDGAD